MKLTTQNQSPVELIWRQFSGKLRSFIHSKVKDETLTDDLLQEVFIKIHRQIGQLKDESKLQSWLYQVTRNTVYDHFRKNEQNLIQDIEEIEAIDEEDDNQFMTETIEDMMKMMNQMPAEYSDVLYLTEIGGMSHKEYAEKSGISATAARTRAFRARNMLKEMMMKCCHYQFDRYGTVIDIQPAGCCCCCDDGFN